MENKKRLPRLNQPTLVTTLPLSGEKVRYRPFVTREQHALNLAHQTEDYESMFSTIEDVLGTCTANTINMETISLGDLAWLFLQIRIAAVGNELRLTTKCEDKECDYDILININLSDVGMSKENNSTIELDSDVSIKFRYPTYRDSLALTKFADDSVAAIHHLVDCVFTQDEVYAKDDYDITEFKEWFGDMNDTQLGKIYEFVDGLPDLLYELKYSCPKCKKEHSKRLEGLQTFFRLSNGGI